MNVKKGALPDHILKRAIGRANELAWSIRDIPLVIGAAQTANLISIGGQLQFRFPEIGTCECYWIEVDTLKNVDPQLPWHDLVAQTAAEAQAQFSELRRRYDFTAEGRNAFRDPFETFLVGGGDLEAATCFVWYVQSETESPPKR